MSDIIARFIYDELEGCKGTLEVSRGQLAERFGCVPSQINYVLSTRFSPEHGYIVETRRGGGGYIRITRVRLAPQALIMHAINAIGDEIDARTAQAFLQNLTSALKPEILRVISAAAGDPVMRTLAPEVRGVMRASILKQCLLVTLS
ncbi:MAG: CtsR family transcriptional regulator [Oscillospiraceae bacterium]|nr:CtsR family transcriptional regulator [Oscillospiraceae bacterium]